MVKTPRHSKPKSESITIDLDEKDVNKIEEDAPEQKNETDAPMQENTDETIEPENETEEQETVARDNQPTSQKSGGSVFAAGLLGAILAVVGASGAQWAGFLPPFSQSTSEVSTELEDKIAALENKLSELGSNSNPDAAIDSGLEIVSLTTRMDDLESLVQNDNESALSALNDLKIRVDQLTSKIINVESAIPEVNTDGQTIALPPDLSEKIAELTDLSQRQATQIGDIKTELNTASQPSDTMSEEAAKLIADLQSRMDQAEKALSEASADVSIARALAATNVKNAINRGGPFFTELEAYVQIDPDHKALAELQPIADKGVLTRAELIAAFPSVANQIIASEQPQSADTNIMTRLLDSATSMVKVRKVGEVEGETTQAIVARMETRLNAGNLTGAINQWNTLSDTAKAASETFAKQLKDRKKAEKFADELMQASPANAG